VGSIANIALVDPAATRIISSDQLASKSRNTPYASMELPGAVVHVLYGGNVTVRDGALV
jgi:dihydroorotase